MTVLIVSRMHFLREMLKNALRSDADIVAIDGFNPETVNAATGEDLPDLVIVDSSHPDGFALVSAIRARFPGVSLVVLAVTDRDEDFFAWADIGISGYVEPETSTGELIAIIRRSMAGETVCPPRLTALLLNRFAQQSSSRQVRGGVHGLTGREREVLELLADGLSNKLIARRLDIAEATVKNHVHSILEKWNLRSRGEAAASYRQSAKEPASQVRMGSLSPPARSPRPTGSIPLRKPIQRSQPVNRHSDQTAETGP